MYRCWSLLRVLGSKVCKQFGAGMITNENKSTGLRALNVVKIISSVNLGVK